ncbi:MAG: stage V sporulation protein AD [Oscillospiraceae bacterium]|jgi:stage V sporulation protein AD|nr:stage V sporulation protein AD [Oscillospiraceae bacterium]MCR5305174.1 stage V sporulation protein AD [Oscillospiraceae bacterium]
MNECSSLLCAEPVSVAAWSSIAGKKEGEGPLGSCFDRIEPDSRFGQNTWEQAESAMQRRAVKLLLQKAGIPAEALSCVIAGDLINQCTSSTFAVRSLNIPYLGIFSACATFAEGLLLGTVLTGSGVPRCAVLTSSHFSSAERQFRFPLAYGGQRTPNAQWTCTAAGAALLTKAEQPPYILGVCPGRVCDMGLTDASNMGAAMAPAAADTVLRYLAATGTRPADYDAIVTGDLGTVGSRLLLELTGKAGTDLSAVHRDCGVMIFDGSAQDTHAGGSGCGCSASVICGYFLPRLRDGRLKNILYAATGALLSPMICQQGESIPGICHLIHLSHFPRKGRLI